GEPRIRRGLGRSPGNGQVHGCVGREPRSGAQSGRAGQIKVNDALTGAALVALAALILWHIQGFPAMPGQKFGPAWFPGLIAIGLAICGALLVRAGLREHAPLFATPQWLQRQRPRRAVAAILAGLVAYILLADALGFHITAILILAVWMRALGASWRLTVAVSILSTLVIHLAFYKVLRVPLPWGVIERWAF
ncbi:MAG: tripartite tricarboxylate transporter TctB family protein, partial [Betaproteobacteria bacterium]